MATMTPTSPPRADPRRGVPRWAWALMALMIVIAVVAVAVAVFAARGRQVLLPPVPAPATPAPPAASGAPSLAPAPTLADGCLGGVSELDRAVLTAQAQAPLTEAGAAAFTATLVRWTFTGPPPPFQEVTARQVFTRDATDAARQSLSSSIDPEGSTAAVNFVDGRYYVEAFDRDSAIVSYLAGVIGTSDGVQLAPATVGGAVHLEAVNGTWRYRDLTLERSIEDLQRIGVPYSGGC